MSIHHVLCLFPLALLVSFPAGSGDQESRYWEVSRLLESTAVDESGEPLGDVEDIVFGAKGEIYAVLVDHDPAAIAAGDEEPVEEGRVRGMYEEILSTGFEGARFTPESKRLELVEKPVRVEADTLPATERSPVGRFPASRVVGARVNLADEPRFGKVADILVSPGTSQAYAIVVESGLLGRERHLFPPVFSAFDEAKREMNFAVGGQEIEAK